ncbi:ATP synthase E chain [Perilla frutescens var. hirtella]|uniref:ATP synthase E chain n=1 Tax=Perilla frutescens var. hirtella TaxID=608512 RepID=A0AAD4NXK1_PERFH|nr:ATP synthase E chain [Perilla frutescens var. hirtella]KAH6767234.1 ATP synthase E chain [Perilla frutescens var. hirtella]KAH6811942.1 ATP synthase E chain [Perilla frutescens var. frutescens]
MAPPPGPYSGKSTFALVARVSAFTVGLAYGSVKLKYLKMKAKSQKKAEAKAHH